jgi:polyisoprenoid-binding protein YceI
MSRRSLLTGFFLVVAVLGQGAMALSRSSDGSVTVFAHAFAGLRIEGKSSRVSVDQDAATLTFRVPIAPIETGIELRDRHMRDALEAERFPNAVLRIARSGLTYPGPHRLAEGTASGELTLHGLTRPVSVKYRAEMGTGGSTKVRGTLQIDMRDFEIRYPSYLGVTVAPEVEVEVEVELAVDAA